MQLQHCVLNITSTVSIDHSLGQLNSSRIVGTWHHHADISPFPAHMFSCSEFQHLKHGSLLSKCGSGKVPDIVIIYTSPLITWNHCSRVILLLIIMVPFTMFYITSWRGQVALTLQPINSLKRTLWSYYFERQILFFEFGNISRMATHEFTEP